MPWFVARHVWGRADEAVPGASGSSAAREFREHQVALKEWVEEAGPGAAGLGAGGARAAHQGMRREGWQGAGPGGPTQV